MAAAREVCRQHFGNRVFLYGFIYLSTYCRNQCAFCFYRRSNERSPRYRKNVAEVLDAARRLADSGVHLVDLTSGEDPVFHDKDNFQLLCRMVESVKQETAIPLMISPGVVPDTVIKSFAELGADWYALYQETHNRDLFRSLRLGQAFTERSAKRVIARRSGMLVEDGYLIGVGESISDRAKSIISMRESCVRQARVMSFIPQPGTPFAGKKSPSRISEYLCIAVMRLAMPDTLIPASLDIDGIKGLEMRLKSGANVVTSIIPPRSMLAGVAQSSLDVEQGRRTVSEVKKSLAGLQLHSGDRKDYESWVAVQKQNTPQIRPLQRSIC